MYNKQQISKLILALDSTLAEMLIRSIWRALCTVGNRAGRELNPREISVLLQAVLVLQRLVAYALMFLDDKVIKDVLLALSGWRRWLAAEGSAEDIDKLSEIIYCLLRMSHQLSLLLPKVNTEDRLVLQRARRVIESLSLELREGCGKSVAPAQGVGNWTGVDNNVKVKYSAGEKLNPKVVGLLERIALQSSDIPFPGFNSPQRISSERNRGYGKNLLNSIGGAVRAYNYWIARGNVLPSEADARITELLGMLNDVQVCIDAWGPNGSELKLLQNELPRIRSSLHKHLRCCRSSPYASRTLSLVVYTN